MWGAKSLFILLFLYQHKLANFTFCGEQRASSSSSFCISGRLLTSLFVGSKEPLHPPLFVSAQACQLHFLWGAKSLFKAQSATDRSGRGGATHDSRALVKDRRQARHDGSGNRPPGGTRGPRANATPQRLCFLWGLKCCFVYEKRSYIRTNGIGAMPGAYSRAAPPLLLPSVSSVRQDIARR